MGFGVSTTSCEDMLTPDMSRYSEGFSGNDTVYFYLGILRNVQDMVEQNQLLGDLRSDLVKTTSYSSDSISHIINFEQDEDGENGLLNRAAYYKVINQCNFYLAKVDTAAVKNGNYYMKREYAQVVNIRAWTYLQLVQTYGRVPFITRPVDNADTGWETSPEDWATADNLVNLLHSDLEKAQNIERTLGYPQYGDFQSGNSNFSVSSSYLRFYADVLLGDLYLLRSNGQSDYVAAARSYYTFLLDQVRNSHYVSGSFAQFNEVTMGSRKNYYPSVMLWTSNGLSATSLQNENVTLIPSAANNSFGRVLTRTAQIYGFDPSSTNSTTSDTEGESVESSGSVSLTVNYKSRQVEPSAAYLNLCAAQDYTDPEFGGTGASQVVDVDYYEGAGDARLYGTAPIFDLDEGRMRFIVKDAPVTSSNMNGEAYAVSFRHYKSIYRLKQIYLRYAEALNRAGYPRTAFMILRNGIDYNKIPQIADSIHYDDVAQTKQTVYYLDSATVYNAANYIGVDELRRAQADPNYSFYLDFSSTYWQNYGIHEQGCGTSSNLDTLYTYDEIVPQRIQDEFNRTGYTIEGDFTKGRAGDRRDDTTVGEGEQEGEGEETPEPDRESYTEIEPADPAVPTMAEINAVETLIADECALETAFEGSRMFDLIRFARHKDNDTSLSPAYGTNWLAWKIARRNQEYAPYEEPSIFDAALYNKMKVQDNWYIANPVY